VAAAQSGVGAGEATKKVLKNQKNNDSDAKAATGKKEKRAAQKPARWPGRYTTAAEYNDT
jgi:hypothetical protein